jgi:uncharacterized protein with GYD domain
VTRSVVRSHAALRVSQNWTDQDSVDRSDAARTALAAKGIDLVDVYWTIGPYDLICLIDAPSPEALSAALLALGAQGNLRSSTMRALSAEEMRGVIAQAG